MKFNNVPGSREKDNARSSVDARAARRLRQLPAAMGSGHCPDHTSTVPQESSDLPVTRPAIRIAAGETIAGALRTARKSLNVALRTVI
jgi:hypothetical protein